MSTLEDPPNPRCTVSVPDVGTSHGGDVHRYTSTQSTGEWWVCDAHAQGAPGRGIHWLRRADTR